MDEDMSDDQVRLMGVCLHFMSLSIEKQAYTFSFLPECLGSVKDPNPSVSHLAYSPCIAF